MFHLLARMIFKDAAHWAARRIYPEKSEGEPLLTEEALIHAKSEHCGCHIIHFYVAARDTVVDCEVKPSLWRELELKKRGLLTHQGGKFYSFEPQNDRGDNHV